MSLLSYNDLMRLVESGVIDADPENVNGTSIDIRLGQFIEVETGYAGGDIWPGVVDLTDKKQGLHFNKWDLKDEDYVLGPGEFVLASSIEKFNLPLLINAEYFLKSSHARCGLEHMHAGHCDPGWNNSTLTLELKNLTRFHRLQLRYGMKIGQMTFTEVAPVPQDSGYATRGQYNNQIGPTKSKGAK